MAACPRCEKRGQTWSGEAPTCAFPDGVFRFKNWNCATMNRLRDLADERAAWSEDSYAAVLSSPDGRHLFLGWYKNRGCTETAFLIHADDPFDTPKIPTLAEAEAVIMHNVSRCLECDGEVPAEREARGERYCSKTCRSLHRTHSFRLAPAAPPCEPRSDTAAATPEPAPAPTSSQPENLTPSGSR